MPIWRGVLQEIQQAESEQDFNDIRAELKRRQVHPITGRKQPGFQEVEPGTRTRCRGCWFW